MKNLELPKFHETFNPILEILSNGEVELDELKKFVPANRFGKPEEVAHLVSFLASDKAAYITGEIININGGIYS